MIKHLAVVMDGNRRWARKNKMDALLGHSKGGVDAAKKTIQFCLDRGIEYLSLYTFSLENLKRSEIEKNFLFDLLIQKGREGLSEFLEQGVKIRFIGDWSVFPQKVKESCLSLEEKTKNAGRLQLNILFCYGARQEIVAAVKTLYQKIKTGLLSEQDVSEKELERCLWMHETPEPDLIIRTGGVKRLSNFLLYQAAYSEFCFLDCLWPEITEEHLEQALAGFKVTKRNFGV